MARNEEKQLARLNRYYLEIKKQEELKKRPPRPRLDTLNTSRELRKWLPTITRDIEFYVKQMEVTCYTEGKIEEIQDRIHRLKQEYRAYMHKLRALEPDLNSSSSWADRPYNHRKRQADSDMSQEREDKASREEPKTQTSSQSGGALSHVVPISTPVLKYMPPMLNQYNFERPVPVVWNVNPDTEDQPLQFAPSTPLAVCHHGFADSTADSGAGGLGAHHSQNKYLALATPVRTWAVSQESDSSGAECNPRNTLGTGMISATVNGEYGKLQCAPPGIAEQDSVCGKEGHDIDTCKEGVHSANVLPRSSMRSRFALTASADDQNTECDSAATDEVCTSGAGQRNCKTDLARTIDSARELNRDEMKKCAEVSSCRDLACGFGNKAVSASPAARCITSDGPRVMRDRPGIVSEGPECNTAMQASVSDATPENEQLEEFSSQAVSMLSDTQQMPSNPLNLDYSDSSDEDV